MKKNNNNLEKKLSQKICELSEKARKSTIIDPKYYESNDVKRGLRDINGEGVLAGLTEISDIVSFTTNEKGEKIPIEGQLYYRGISINDLVDGFLNDDRLGFEETAYLLMFGELPDCSELKEFNDILAEFREELPSKFVRDVILKRPTKDIMNMLSRSVLTLHAYDDNGDDISIPNVLKQGLKLTAQFPLLAVYAYHAYRHYSFQDSLIVHMPKTEYSTAENILHLLRADSCFTPLEAKILDLCLVLHAEHGGGNNSTFTTHVVSSSGSDTYSTVAASLCSLKGFRHGGANIKVYNMIKDIKNNIKSYSDSAILDYLNKILDKKAFDNSGLIYGMGHAVYSLSDPRATILKGYVEKLAKEKNREEDYILYSKIERLAPEAINHKRMVYKGVGANVDFYSGLLYSLLDLPIELYTPIFAIARIAGWTAHRIEELSNNGKIIRPGYKSVCEKQKYTPLKDR